MNKANPFNATERQAVFSLASIVSLRMLGLFLVMPVLSLYARNLEGATVFAAGLAVGIYGLTQAALQLPMGLLSDRIGRKPIIITGLLIFISGSVLAAISTDINTLIVARVLQGSGAIAAALSALAADLTRESQRTKAMAIIGASIGMAFTLSIILGPALVGSIGVPGLFVFAAVAGAIAIVLIIKWTPAEPEKHAKTTGFSAVLHNSQLLRLDFSSLCLHMIVTAGFVTWPMVLTDRLGITVSQHWWIYLSAVLLSFILIVPLIRRVDGYSQPFKLLTAAIVLIILSQSISLIASNLIIFWTALFIFFIGFNFLEANLPALVSKIAPAEYKGGAMGVFTTSQFFGAFLGGSGAGWLYQHYGFNGVSFAALTVAVVWALITLLAANQTLQTNQNNTEL